MFGDGDIIGAVKTFVLGAGASRAESPAMPLVGDFFSKMFHWHRTIMYGSVFLGIFTFQMFVEIGWVTDDNIIGSMQVKFEKILLD